MEKIFSTLVILITVSVIILLATILQGILAGTAGIS